MIAIAVVAFLSLALLADGLRIRARLASVDVLSPSDDAPSEEHAFLVAKGVTLDAATRRAASAFAKQRGLDVLDLVPQDLPTPRLWSLFQFLDPSLYRKDRLGKGLTTAHAVLVSRDVLTRARFEPSEAMDPIELSRAAARLKRYARAEATDLAIAPGLASIDFDPSRRFELLHAQIGEGTDGVLYGVPVVLAILGAAVWFARPYGVAVLAAFHLQPIVAFLFGRAKPRALFTTFVFRTPMELFGWLSLALAPTSKAELDDLAKRRAEYVELTKGGLDRFFEPRREDCPLCRSKNLGRQVAMSDILQHKPGRFSLDRCKDCGHIFQNPRLSIDGLNFYYKDFYDGFGEEQLDAIFGASLPQYYARAKTVTDSHKPERWLDVGGGHGHFCRIARVACPETKFDGLDLSESIEEAERRGWIDKGYRGLFPELAPSIEGRYDVVSMSHYLEHTRDPEEEIVAANKALAPGGVLMIEVPDPDCPLGGVLGRLWLPWFQPQHQHFVSVANLKKLFARHGFEVVTWHRGEAHQRVDLLAAAILFRNWIAPRADVPWRSTSFLARTWRRFAIFATIPLVMLAILCDLVLAWILSKKGSNTYRVLARKKADDAVKAAA